MNRTQHGDRVSILFGFVLFIILLHYFLAQAKSNQCSSWVLVIFTWIISVLKLQNISTIFWQPLNWEYTALSWNAVQSYIGSISMNNNFHLTTSVCSMLLLYTLSSVACAHLFTTNNVYFSAPCLFLEVPFCSVIIPVEDEPSTFWLSLKVDCFWGFVPCPLAVRKSNL